MRIIVNDNEIQQNNFLKELTDIISPN